MGIVISQVAKRPRAEIDELFRADPKVDETCLLDFDGDFSDLPKYAPLILDDFDGLLLPQNVEGHSGIEVKTDTILKFACAGTRDQCYRTFGLTKTSLYLAGFDPHEQDCQIFLYLIYQNGDNIYQTATKLPNNHKIYYTAVIYSRVP
jgi:hypothetical protein